MSATGDVEDAGVGALHPFFVLIALTRATPIPRTPSEQVADSEVVVAGLLDEVMDGRVVDYATGASNPLATAVFRIRVESVVKGPDEPFVYAEFVRGGVPVVRMAELMPRDLPMMFLLRSPGWDPTTYRFEHDGRGLPANATLRAFTYPSGIVVEGTDGIEYPLADDPFADIFQSKTLEELKSELTMLARD